MLAPIIFIAAVAVGMVVILVAGCAAMAIAAAMAAPDDDMLGEHGDIPGPPTFRDVEITEFHGGGIAAPMPTRQRESAAKIPARRNA